MRRAVSYVEEELGCVGSKEETVQAGYGVTVHEISQPAPHSARPGAAYRYGTAIKNGNFIGSFEKHWVKIIRSVREVELTCAE